MKEQNWVLPNNQFILYVEKSKISTMLTEKNLKNPKIAFKWCIDGIVVQPQHIDDDSMLLKWIQSGKAPRSSYIQLEIKYLICAAIHWALKRTAENRQIGGSHSCHRAQLMLRVTYNSINKSKWAIVCDKNLWS